MANTPLRLALLGAAGPAETKFLVELAAEDQSAIEVGFFEALEAADLQALYTAFCSACLLLAFLVAESQRWLAVLSATVVVLAMAVFLLRYPVRAWAELERRATRIRLARLAEAAAAEATLEAEVVTPAASPGRRAA